MVAVAMANSFFDFSAQDAEGNMVPMSKYKDAKVILVGKHLVMIWVEVSLASISPKRTFHWW